MDVRGSPSPSGHVMLPSSPLDDLRRLLPPPPSAPSLPHPQSYSDPSLPFLFCPTRALIADSPMLHSSTTHILSRETQQAAGLRWTAQRWILFPIAPALLAQFTRAEGCHT